jgi:hypothetical protein
MFPIGKYTISRAGCWPTAQPQDYFGGPGSFQLVFGRPEFFAACCVPGVGCQPHPKPICGSLSGRICFSTACCVPWVGCRPHPQTTRWELVLALNVFPSMHKRHARSQGWDASPTPNPLGPVGGHPRRPFTISAAQLTEKYLKRNKFLHPVDDQYLTGY